MITATDFGYNVYIGGLQPIPRDPKDNGVAAMLVVQQKELMRNLMFMTTNMAAMM